MRLSELFTPHPRQVEFFESTDKYLFTLFGGARGGGKSFAGRWAVVRKLLQYTAKGIVHLRAGIFCNTYPELKIRQWDEATWDFPSWLGRFNKSEMSFTFKEEYGGHIISFLNLDKPEKYKSAQFAIVLVEEITLIPDPSILSIFLGFLRWPGIDRPTFIATTNPDGPGHSWVKALWLTGKAFEQDEFRNMLETIGKEEFNFVRSLPTDNPSLPETYVKKNLAGLPPYLRKAWLEGSWDLFEGQRFVINENVHVIKGIDQVKYLHYFKSVRPNVWRSLDYGFDNPYACTWYAVLPGNVRPKVVLYREDAQSGLRARQQARQAMSLTADEWEKTGLRGNYLDTAAWKEEDEGLSIADKLMAEGLNPLYQVLKDRATGWVAVEDLLAYELNEDGAIVQEPLLKIFETCPKAIQQLTDAQWDPKKPGDILHPEGFRDDVLDTIRYFALTHFFGPTLKEKINPNSPQWDRMIWDAIHENRNLANW